MPGNRIETVVPVRRPLSCWKKLLFASVTTVLFFAVLEVGLALWGIQPISAKRDPFVGFASWTPLFHRETESDGQIVMATAENKLPWFNDQRFRLEKSAGTYRIFCLGGSTTYGRPYDDTTSFAGWLRELLPEVDPSRNWEVINAGGISYASYRIAVLMEELLEYDPDLLIVYSGHNEFLEERTYRHIRRLPTRLLQGAAVLNRSRTHAVISSMWDSGNRSHLSQGDSRFTLPAEVSASLDHTVGPTDYVRDDPLRQHVLEHFEWNMQRMIDLARSAGVEVMFVVPASNWKDCRPFKSQHRDDLQEVSARQWTWLYERGRTLHREERWAEALDLYRQAARIDDRFSELHYWMGRALLELRRTEEAQTAWERSIDEDVCPLRAPTEVVAAVRRIGLREDVSVIDFPALIKEESQRMTGQPIPGREFFLDHVHPTIDGHLLLSRAILSELIQRQIVAPNPAWPDRAVEAARQRVEERIDPEFQGVALRNLAKVLSWAGKHDEAGPLALQALEKLPGDPESTYLAACYLKMTGQTAQAADYFRQALPHRIDDPEAHLLLADTLVAENSLRASLDHYRRALELQDHDHAAIHLRAGTVLVELGELEQALSHLRQALHDQPSNPDLHYNLGIVSHRLRDLERAEHHYNQALTFRPQFAEARNNLGLLLVEADRYREAIAHFRQILDLDPDHQAAQKNLQIALQRQRERRDHR